MVTRWKMSRHEKLKSRVLEVLRARVDLRMHPQLAESLNFYDPSTSIAEMLPSPGYSSFYDWVVTEAVWLAVEWSRPIRYERIEGKNGGAPTFKKIIHPAVKGVSRKPTWKQICRWFDEWDLLASKAWFERFNAFELYPRQAKSAALTAPVPSRLATAGVHLGEGLDHAPAMIYHAHRGTMAGVAHPRAVMKDGGGAAVDLWTQADTHELLTGQAELVNHSESARNMLELQAREIAADWFDDKGGLNTGATPEQIHAARMKSYLRTVEFLQPANLDALLQTRIRELGNPGALPDDLPTLKKVLCERLEAASMAKTKELMKAATQQGIDRGFSCVDEERAVKEVAKECVLGSLEIKAAEDEIYRRTKGKWGIVAGVADLPENEQHSGTGKPTSATGSDNHFYRRTGSGIAAAKAAFDAAVKKIEAVTVLNVPVWKIGSTRYATPGATHGLAGTEFTIEAVQPTVSPAVPGRVTIGAFVKARYADGKEVGGVRVVHGRVPGDATAAQARVRLPAGETKPVSVEMGASNLCGPTTIAVTVTPK